MTDIQNDKLFHTFCSVLQGKNVRYWINVTSYCKDGYTGYNICLGRKIPAFTKKLTNPL